jgi:hypothetical protein
VGVTPPLTGRCTPALMLLPCGTRSQRLPVQRIAVSEVAAVGACAYAVFLLTACLAKLDGWEDWITAGAAWLPDRSSLLRLVPAFIPATEAMTVVVIVISPQAGLAAAACLLAAFAIGAAWIGHRSGPLSCGCFGSLARSHFGARLAARNGMLSIGAGTMALLAHRVGLTAISLPATLVAAVVAPLVILVGEARARNAVPSFRRIDVRMTR